MPEGMNEENRGIKPNNELSDMDKAFMTINYPPDGKNNKMEWTFEKALDVAGVGERRKYQIIQSYQKSGWAKVRDEIRSWRDKSRSSDDSRPSHLAPPVRVYTKRTM